MRNWYVLLLLYIVFLVIGGFEKKKNDDVPIKSYYTRTTDNMERKYTKMLTYLSPETIKKQKEICAKYGFDYVEGETMDPDILEFVLKGEREWRDNNEKKKKEQLINNMRSTIGKNGGIIDGFDFERFCAYVLDFNGFDCEVTKGSGDHGADIIASKDEISYAIQCKYYETPVGNKAVQEAFTGKAYYHTDKAVVMTNNDFTRQAISDASQIGVELWNGNKIMELMQSI